MDELCISDQRCLFVGGDGVKRSIIILCVVCLVISGCVGGGEVVVERDHADHSDHDHGAEEVWACCKALTASCIACSEGLTKQEWLDKTCGPGCTDAIYAGWDEETKKMKWDCIY